MKRLEGKTTRGTRPLVLGNGRKERVWSFINSRVDLNEKGGIVVGKKFGRRHEDIGRQVFFFRVADHADLEVGFGERGI